MPKPACTEWTWLLLMDCPGRVSLPARRTSNAAAWEQPDARAQIFLYARRTESWPAEDVGRRCGGAQPANHTWLAPERTEGRRDREAELVMRVPVRYQRNGKVGAHETARLFGNREQQAHPGAHANGYVLPIGNAARPHATGVGERRDPDVVEFREAAEEPAMLGPQHDALAAHEAGVAIAAHAAIVITQRELKRRLLSPRAGKLHAPDLRLVVVRLVIPGEPSAADHVTPAMQLRLTLRFPGGANGEIGAAAHDAGIGVRAPQVAALATTDP